MIALLKKTLRNDLLPPSWIHTPGGWGGGAREGLHPAPAEPLGGELFSKGGNLSFNVRLMAIPRELREYVVVHELAHLRHLNHSKAFWEFVGRFYPSYKTARKELGKWWTMIELNPYWKWLAGGERYEA